MSSKKFVYLLMMAAIVCGFIASDVAHAKDFIFFEGTVTKSDGTSVAGLVLRAERIDHGTEGVQSGLEDLLVNEVTLGADGTYKFTFSALSFGGVQQITRGERIEFSVASVGHRETYEITAADLAPAVPSVTLNITLADISVDATPSELAADGAMTATITVEVGGTAGAGDTVTINAPTKGTVGDVVDQGGGVYTATYTAPLDRALSLPETVQITANSANLGRSASTLITLLPIPVTVTVELGKNSFMADTPEDTTVSVTVDQAGPVAGATVTLALSPAVGSVSAVTDDGGGSYSATYTSGGTSGNVTLTATASGASDSATIVINAGPPAAIALSAAHGTVPSLSSTTITAMVTDSNGNAAGAALTGATMSGGTVGEFSSTVFGTYTATYTAPMIDVGAQVAETVTVSTDGISNSLMLNLLGEPPIDVDALEIRGTVYKADGEIIADGVAVTVTVESSSETDTAGADGSYGVAFLGFGQTVATTGNTLSVAVDGAGANNVVALTVNGVKQPGSEVLLLNAILEKVAAGEAVAVDVTTDIPIPPRFADSLSVTGTVYKEDGTTPAGAGLSVEVTVGSQTDTDTTDVDGSYGVAFLGFGTPVAASHEIVIVVASDATGQRGTNDSEPIRNIELPEVVGHAEITRNVNTDIGLTSISLTVAGTVYLENGDTPVAASNDLREGALTVVVTNTTRNLTESRAVKADGTYSLAFFNPIMTVAETGDEITVEVKNEAGDTVGSESHTLGIPDLQAERVAIKVPTSVPAQVGVLHIIGNVVELDGSPAAPGLPVTIRLDMRDGSHMVYQTTTKADGSYVFAELNLATPIAGTGDILNVDILRAADQFRGHSGDIYLSSSKLVPTNQPVEVPDITLIPPRLELGGLSINPHYTGIQDSTVQELLGMDLAGLAAGAASAVDPTGSLVMLPPSLPLLIAPALGVIGTFQLELPEGFDADDENIAKESFGNAITTRPTAWAAFPAAERTPGRWINGNQLNLYISGAPTIEGVTFTLGGASVSAMSVPEGGSFPYTFQLEEEWAALFFSGNMSTFGAVTLLVDGHAPVPMTRGDGGVWSADVMLTPGSDVSYYYMVTLSEPYVDPLGGVTITSFPFIDPLNRQAKTGSLLKGLTALFSSELAGDPQVRSVFSVPEVNYQQSLWVGKFDLNTDGMHQLDVNVTYRGSNYEDNITGKTLIVDRTAPSTDVALNLDYPGHNAGLYMREDGTYVATGLKLREEASLTVTPTTPLPEAAAYMVQLARLDALDQPGTWNPVITADLLPLDLETLLTNPGSVLPLSLGNPIDMLIRNSEGGRLLGRYGLRAVGIDSLLNMDSGKSASIVVDLVPPDPDIAAVTQVITDFDGNDVIEGLEVQSAAGDVAVYSDSLVTLNVAIMERTDHPLASIVLEYQIPGSDWLPIGGFGPEQLADAMMGDQMQVPLPVPDIPGLPDRGAPVRLRTVTTNALNVVNEHVITAQYLRRTAPEVSAVYAYVTDYNADSGAPQGLITVSAFTQAMSNPDTTAVQLEIRRSADADWAPLGIVQLANSKVTSHVQIAIIEDLINSIVAGAPTAPISPLYREWPLTIDSATLEDTIMDDTPAASDASLDDNPYVLRAIAVDVDAARYESAATDSFSLDNYSPTTIKQLANEVEMVAAREDGSYYVSGLLHESVPDPMLTLTGRTGAHPNAFQGGLKLVVNDAAGEAVEADATDFSAAGGVYYTSTLNLASLANGTYTFMAVGHTAEGVAEERIVAMAITVEVGNFTPPDNFADPTVDIVRVIDTRGDASSPSEIDAKYVTGFPADGEEVCATLIVPNVSSGDLDVLIGDDGMSANAMGILMVTDDLELCIDTSGLEEDMYGLVGVVNKPNGSVQFGLPSIRVDRTGPALTIVSPLEGHQTSSLPTVQVSYSDATGFDPEKRNPRAIEISLTRLGSHKEVTTNPEMIRAVTAAGEVLTQNGNISYTHDEPLAGGAYRIDVSVTDALGNTGSAAPVEFTSTGVAAGVTIVSPAPGGIIPADQPLIISAALTGNGEITVTDFLINGGSTKPPALKDNWLTHTIDSPFGALFKRGAGNRITIKIVDEEGNTAEATSNFALEKDTTPPVIATYSPLGIIRTDRPIAAATVTDESGIDTSSLTIIIAGVPGNQGTGRRSSATSTTVTFTPSISVDPGPYTARVTVLDTQGNRNEFEWQFTVELDVTPPAVTASAPHGVIRTDKPVVSVSVSDDMSGVDTIEIGVKNAGNQTVDGVTSVRSDKTSATFTPTAALTSGVYTVDVKLADVAGNKASGQWQFTVELDTIPPSVLNTRPTQEHTENRRPTISAIYTDNMSGVDAASVKLWLDGSAVEPDDVSNTQVTFTPKFDLTFDQHMVKLEVSDSASTPNTAVHEWSFYVERMGIANARNYPNPFDHDTTIACRISRQASITVQIYDFTGRLVAQPITNSVREAGLVEIEWHGETSNGDHLARGVYFCHILMESELEPQSAILKMAIIRD